MRPTTSLPLLFILSLFHRDVFSAPLNIQDSKDSLDVGTICSKVPNSKSCTTLKTNMRQGDKPDDDLTSLKKEIESLNTGVKAAVTKVEGLLKDDSLDSETRKTLLPKCQTLYRSATTSLDKVNKAVDAKDGETLQNSCNSIYSFASLCEDAFDEFNLLSPLKGENKVIQLVAMNCRGLAKKLPTGAAPSPGLSPIVSSPTAQPPQTNNIPPTPSPSGASPAPEPDVGGAPLTSPTDPASSPASDTSSNGGSGKSGGSLNNALGVKGVCAVTNHMPFCMSAIQTVSTRNLDAATPAEVLKLVVQATIYNTRTAIDMANTFFKAHSAEPKVQDILLNVCLTKYRAAIKTLEGAEAAIAAADKAKLRDSLAVIENYKSCDRAFTEAKLARVMEDYDDDLRELVGINLAIAKSFWPDPLFDKEYANAIKDD